MDDSEKSLAYKLGVYPTKVQKNAVTPAAKQTVAASKIQKNIVNPVPPAMAQSPSLIVSSVKLTAKDIDHLNVLAKATGKTVSHSAIIRSLVRLAVSDLAIQKKLMALIAIENIHSGRPRKKP